MTQHGVLLVQGVHLQLDGLEVHAHLVGQHFHVGGLVGQELVQRRIQQAHRHFKPVHGPEDAFEIALLHGLDLGQSHFAGGQVLSQDHLAHFQNAVFAKEHVLGAAQADALGAELAGLGRIVGCIGVGAHLQPAGRVGPAHDLGQVWIIQVRRHQGRSAINDRAGGAVDRQHFAGGVALAADAHGAGFCVNHQVTATGHTGLAHATGHHGRVTGHAPTAGQDALGHIHARDVFGAGLTANQDHFLALSRGGHGIFGTEDDLALGCARAGRQANAHLGGLRFRIDLLVQQLVQVIRLHQQQGLIDRHEPLGLHLGRDANGRHAGALAAARLQHPKTTVLDGEFDILVVLVVGFQVTTDLVQGLVRLGHDFVQGR